MERNNPFPCQRVHYHVFAPQPTVVFLEKDEDDNEVVKEFTPPEFYKTYPLPQKCFSLDELLAAGVPLKQIDTHLYESKDPADRPWTPAELLDDARVIAEEISKQQSQTITE